MKRLKLLSFLLIPLTACQQTSIIHNVKPGNATPHNTVKEIMTGAVEPITNALWAVAMDENIPKNDEDWKNLENQSIQLLTVTAALSQGGSGPNDGAWSQDERWQAHLRQLEDIGNQFLQASRNQNYQGLLDAGDLLIEPCSNCHTDFPAESQ